MRVRLLLSLTHLRVASLPLLPCHVCVRFLLLPHALLCGWARSSGVALRAPSGDTSADPVAARSHRSHSQWLTVTHSHTDACMWGGVRWPFRTCVSRVSPCRPNGQGESRTASAATMPIFLDCSALSIVSHVCVFFFCDLSLLSSLFFSLPLSLPLSTWTKLS